MESPSSPIRRKLTGSREEHVRSNVPSVTTTTRNSVAAHTSHFLLPGKECRAIAKDKIKAVIDSPCVTIGMSLITVYVLFADDLRVLTTSVHSDDCFFAVAAICMFMFTLEIVLSLYAKPEYRNSYYFYLDSLSTIFLVTDIGWLWSYITMSGSQGDQISQVKHASKSSQTAARGVKVVRIVRLVRLTRLVKIYKNAQIAMKRRTPHMASVAPGDTLQIPQESNVGKRLSELTTKRVILLVLVLILLLPLFDSDLYFSDSTSSDFALKQLVKFDGSMALLECVGELHDFHGIGSRPLLLLSRSFDGNTEILNTSVNVDDLRLEEKYYASSAHFVGIFDIRRDVQLAAGLSICRTIFVAVVMAFGALQFTQDAQKLVINPIEKMMRKVNSIARDPIRATEEKITDMFEEEEEPQASSSCCSSASQAESHFETKLLEDTLLKISALLCLGLGEAGAKMISQNLSKQHELDLFLDGTRMIGIFGFCDIRNFTDTTEILQEDVMLFVNQIAKIVHSTVASCLGAANKNIGDAFLLVWKFDDDDLIGEGRDLALDQSSFRVQNLCELALVSFLRIIVKINSSPQILAYRKHPELVKKMPGYSVRMGLGMHLGWAIEGAIGSELKIDASYLSPHVNMASRLEAATKQFGVYMLLSGSLVKHLPTRAVAYCRHIDTVIVKGSTEPVELYTSDIGPHNLGVRREGLSDKSTALRNRRDLRQKITSEDFDSTVMLDNFGGIEELRKGVTAEFLRTFAAGVDAYRDGRWREAKGLLEAALALKERDGPAVALLDAMKQSDFEAPQDWKGVRMLMEK